MRPPLPVIGWREWVGLPDLGVPGVKAKVDTGARSSSLHAVDLHPFERDGQPWVRFCVYPKQRSRTPSISVEAPVLEYRDVRSSNGKTTRRPVIATTLELGDARWPVELTLASRDQMGFRMLLGREAFRRRFLVDAGRSFCLGRPPTAEPRRPRRSRRKPPAPTELP